MTGSPEDGNNGRMLPASNRSRQIGLLLIVVTAIGWGLNWPIVKLVLRDWPPLFARGVAGVAAASGLALAAMASVAVIATFVSRKAHGRSH